MQQSHNTQRRALERFVPEAMEYLDRALGDATAFYGREALAATIHYGVERARSYGIVGRHDVCHYLRLMCTLLGSDFDQDPLYPWAADILKDSYTPPNDKIMRLVGQADQFLWQIQQREPHYFKRVLACTRNNLFSRLPDSVEPRRLQATVLMEVRNYLPGKVSCVGEVNVTLLIEQGAEEARAQGLQRGPDIAAFIQFMFIHGVHFYSDPRFPQTRAIFSGSATTGKEKIEAMFSQTRRFLLHKLHLIRA